MKSEAEVREELRYWRRRLAALRPMAQPEVGRVDAESAVLILEWILHPHVKLRTPSEVSQMRGWLWWKCRLYRLFPGFRIREDGTKA